MDKQLRKHIVVLTGAGISAESGLKTFRDSDGLWNGYRVEEVATPEAFEANPALVLDFYNMRRKDAAAAQPNEAHLNVAQLEKQYRVSVITQNVDDLHERAGSTHILHLHGQLNKMRSIVRSERIYDIESDMHVDDRDPFGDPLRPHIVWFGEAVPAMSDAVMIAEKADALVIIGTSLQVYPAASLAHYVPTGTPIIVIDRKIPRLDFNGKVHAIEAPATEGTRQLQDLLQGMLH
jgi:NAD-dependent deacetylase